MKVAVFGGGISGLTVADELTRRGFRVSIYEKNKILGGMARSERINDNVPSEHSWRGYGAFYQNVFDIFSKIPTANNHTVLDNLSKPIHFILPHDDKEVGDATTFDRFYVGYYILRAICSDKRKEIYANEEFKRTVYGMLSQGGRDNFISMLGPGLGLQQDRTSIQSVAKFIELKYEGYGPDWLVLNGPTNEAWIDYWEDTLNSLGTNIYKNTSLLKIIFDNDQIQKCILDDGREVTADEYVFCLDPYSFSNILYGNQNILNLPIPVIQISFRFGFDIETYLPNKMDVLAFPDSEFNITLYFQEKFWPNTSIPYAALWSGTACVTNRKGRLYNKCAIDLTDDEFLVECWYQISRSKELQSLLTPYLPQPVYSEVWKQWRAEPKWGNVIGTYNNRITQDTDISNMHIGGAHTDTSVDIYSMEGAVESGKIIGQNILDKYGRSDNIKIHMHKPPKIFLELGEIDNLLYKYKLPNIIDIILFILLICIVSLTIKKINSYSSSFATA